MIVTKHSVLIGIVILLIGTGCSLLKSDSSPYETDYVIELDTIRVTNEIDVYPYRPSETRVWDLLHTKLDVRFDWEKQYLYGKANLTLTPYFYASELVTLDAKGMDINEVSLVRNGFRSELPFQYDGAFIQAELPNRYTKADTIELFIEYTAKPNELELEAGDAITDAKGLYFINPLGEDPNKPMQIWTQGEVESSSCWFPTIDAPNERTTQELCMTVQDTFKTLSNGTLTFSTLNGDGSRTDCWEQDLPHAPYLFMMAVGDFAVVKDTLWDTLEVSYYVEPEYEVYARDIFGKTSKMVETYSEMLGVTYPWDKYAQVVVRDYVSGAMENTSAVIFGDFAQCTKRELIEDNPEDVIAHELFHHWFGDLVTCESWSNLPLNESFATYGEYLWFEAEYGRAKADIHLQVDLENYLDEFNGGKAENMIRFHYDVPLDMFDRHSYSKGGRILHMLRKYVGDEAFFAGLKKYLNDNAYRPAEIHHLRLALEEITGEDLNWFFNQWFLSSGHPQLTVEYSYNDSLKQQVIHVKQNQNLELFPLYKLPIDVDLYYSNNRVERQRIVIDKADQYIALPVIEAPLAVDFDAEKMLLAEIENRIPIEWHIALNQESDLYITQMQAMEAFGAYAKKQSRAKDALTEGLSSDNWGVQLAAIEQSDVLFEEDEEGAAAIFHDLVRNASYFEVRYQALNQLADRNLADTSLLKAAIQDEAYSVVYLAMQILIGVDLDMAIATADTLQQDPYPGLKIVSANAFAFSGKARYEPLFLELDTLLSSYDRIDYYVVYSIYALNSDNDAIINRALKILEKGAVTDDIWFIRYYAIDGINKLRDAYKEQLAESSERDKAMIQAKIDDLNAILKRIKAQTEDNELQSLFSE